MGFRQPFYITLMKWRMAKTAIKEKSIERVHYCNRLVKNKFYTSISRVQTGKESKQFLYDFFYPNVHARHFECKEYAKYCSKDR